MELEKIIKKNILKEIKSLAKKQHKLVGKFNGKNIVRIDLNLFLKNLDKIKL